MNRPGFLAAVLGVDGGGPGYGVVESILVAGYHEQPGASVLDELRQAAALVADDRCAEGERFDDGGTAGFVPIDGE